MTLLKGRTGGPDPVRRPRVTSVQLKAVMAVSGGILLLYLFVHMLGN